MKKILRFEDLKAWQESRELTRLVYDISKKINSKERNALINQIQRSVVSIMANIAEGFGRFGLKDSKHFLLLRAVLWLRHKAIFMF